MILSEWFQLGPIGADAIYGTYNWQLVLLSFLVATFASYIALDMAGRLRDDSNSKMALTFWLLGGAFAMGAGIWSMHFIGMLAFQMNMPMSFNSFWTIVSMLVAILASFIALSLLMGKTLRRDHLIIGGFFLGIAIASMHYTGMYAMTDTMDIRYLPNIFVLSIIIAIVAAEAALWLAIRSNQGVLRVKIRLKIISAIVMGLAICGMHYTGMAAAIFYPKQDMTHTLSSFNHNMLSVTVAGVTFVILGIAFAISTHNEIMKQQVISTARLAGMAEVSSSVLHSVGNVLNSLNVSTLSIGERIEHSKTNKLSDFNDLIQKNQHDLGKFFTEDPKAETIPAFISALSEYWQTERKELLKEIQSVLNSIQHIKEIISAQQSVGNFSILEQKIEIQSALDEAIKITGITLSTGLIKLTKEYGPVKPILIDKTKLLQILVNIIRNAKDALLMASTQDKNVHIKLYYAQDQSIVVEISDNGMGINPDNLKKIFTHGFTTKESGHGYGLHSSAILAKQMGGSLNGSNKENGQGAVFILVLPPKNNS